MVYCWELSCILEETKCRKHIELKKKTQGLKLLRRWVWTLWEKMGKRCKFWVKFEKNGRKGTQIIEWMKLDALVIIQPSGLDWTLLWREKIRLFFKTWKDVETFLYMCGTAFSLSLSRESHSEWMWSSWEILHPYIIDYITGTEQSVAESRTMGQCVPAGGNVYKESPFLSVNRSLKFI